MSVNRVSTLIFVTTTAVSATTRGQNIQVQFDTKSQQILGPSLSLAEQQVELQIEQSVQSLLGSTDTSELLRAGANTQSLVSRGLGADYGSAPDGLLLGVGVSASISGDSFDIDTGNGTTTVPTGASAQVSILVGYNFAALNLPELTLFAHGMGAPVNFSGYEGSFYNGGVSAQYRVLAPRGTAAINWGGVSVTSGLEVSKMRLGLGDQDALAVSTNVGGVQISGTPGLELVQTAITVPLELTTSVTAAKFFTLYGGTGLDFNFGSSSIVAGLDTTIQAPASLGGDTGSVTASYDDSASPTAVVFRVLGGAQFNLGPVHLFSQLNVVPVQKTVSVAGGARVTF